MWVKLDGGWASHPKVRAAGRDGRALWAAAASICGDKLTDGRVPAMAAKDAAYLAEVSQRKATAALVQCGLWHDGETIMECADCLEVYGDLATGEHVFHAWWEYQPTRDESLMPVHMMRFKQRKALHRDRSLCERIIARDKSRCRYCGAQVNWKDRRGPQGATYDHVDPHELSSDPNVGNTLLNVVVACRACNTAKGDRTPEEAHMTLLGPPGSRPSSNQVAAKSNLVGTSSETSTHARTLARGAGPGPNLVPARSANGANGNGNGHG